MPAFPAIGLPISRKNRPIPDISHDILDVLTRIITAGPVDRFRKACFGPAQNVENIARPDGYPDEAFRRLRKPFDLAGNLRLRRKLEVNPSEPKLIVTERGAGYVFAAPVEVL